MRIMRELLPLWPLKWYTVRIRTQLRICGQIYPSPSGVPLGFALGNSFRWRVIFDRISLLSSHYGYSIPETCCAGIFICFTVRQRENVELKLKHLNTIFFFTSFWHYFYWLLALYNLPLLKNATWQNFPNFYEKIKVPLASKEADQKYIGISRRKKKSLFHTIKLLVQIKVVLLQEKSNQTSIPNEMPTLNLVKDTF